MLSYCIILQQTLKNKTFSPKYEFFMKLTNRKKRFFQNGKIIGKSLQIQDALTDKSDKAI